MSEGPREERDGTDLSVSEGISQASQEFSGKKMTKKKKVSKDKKGPTDRDDSAERREERRESLDLIAERQSTGKTVSADRRAAARRGQGLIKNVSTERFPPAEEKISTDRFRSTQRYIILISAIVWFIVARTTRQEGVGK